MPWLRDGSVIAYYSMIWSIKMIFEKEGKVLLVHRRLFNGDQPRIFIGVIQDAEQGLIKVRGHSWLQDHRTGAVFRKEDERTKIFAVISGALMIYELPHEVDLPALKFINTEDGRSWLTDEKHFRMDLSENERMTEKESASFSGHFSADCQF